MKELFTILLKLVSFHFHLENIADFCQSGDPLFTSIVVPSWILSYEVWRSPYSQDYKTRKGLYFRIALSVSTDKYNIRNILLIAFS